MATPPASTINDYRLQIDTLDDEILALLEKRASLSQAIGVEKKAKGLGYLDVKRESLILKRLRQNSDLLEPHIVAIYREILAACRASQQPTSVAFLGPLGTYSHAATIGALGHAINCLPTASFADSLMQVEKGLAQSAVVPFENSIAGSVGETLDLLVNTPLMVQGEIVLRIRHNLLVPQALKSIPLEEIKVIYGHPQALYQCRHWLQAHAPQADLMPSASNTSAAHTLSEQAQASALIGSTLSAEIYQLFNRAADIEDSTDNTTRFLIMGTQPSAPSGDDKTSFIMSVHHRPGSMSRALKPLADQGVNMTKLESRPVQMGEWKYVFFVDILGHQAQEPVKSALAAVQEHTAFLKVLGSYPQAIR